MRSHDSYHKRCVKNISASWTLGLWEFVGLLRLKKANITPAARSVASRRPQNNENNGGIVKKRLQNLFSENRITKTAARKKNNLQNGTGKIFFIFSIVQHFDDACKDSSK